MPHLATVDSDRATRTVEYSASLNEKDVSPEAVESQYVTGKKLIAIFVSLLSSVFLVQLDQTIVATALPKIVSQFDALSEVTWIATAYFLTQAGFMLSFGQLISVAPTKWVLLALIFIFELGSLLCGVAPNMKVLIFGRAVAGVGGGGIAICVLTIFSEILPLEKRPLSFGAFGALFALSSVVGPILGGVFADHVSWRWCFYINLPIGAASMAFIAWFLEARPAKTNAIFPRQGWKKYLDLDWFGTVLCIGMTTTLLVPLQQGGTTKAWSDPAVYALFPVFGVLLAAFIGWEWRMGPRAIMPLSMFKRRTLVGSYLSSFFIFLGLLTATFYLPLWYQATRGASATKSGIDILPYMLSVVVAAGISGGIITKSGRYWPFLLGSPLLLSVGGGLLYTVAVNTPNARVIGFQILYGIGVGGALTNSLMAIQAEFVAEPEMIAQGTSLVSFTQLLGGVIGIAISGTVFANQLRSHVASISADGGLTLSPEMAKAVVASVTVIQTLPDELKGAVINAYVQSLRPIFLIAVPAGVFASMCALLIKNYDLRTRGGAGSAMVA